MSLIVIEGSNGSGKTDIISRVIEKYDIIDKKSIPDWYRSKLEFARKCPFDMQKDIYLCGHKANYLECNKEENYIFDRYVYSTIIRINYELKKQIDETINEILNYENKADLIIVLKSNKDEIKKRLAARNNFDFNEDFYNYENQIYEQLSKISDIMFIVDNNGDIDDTIETISNIVEQKIDFRKKASYERRI